jgi:hypothetical protein
VLEYSAFRQVVRQNHELEFVWKFGPIVEGLCVLPGKPFPLSSHLVWISTAKSSREIGYRWEGSSIDKRLKGSVALIERCGGDEWSERRLQGII